MQRNILKAKLQAQISSPGSQSSMKDAEAAAQVGDQKTKGSRLERAKVCCMFCDVLYCFVLCRVMCVTVYMSCIYHIIVKHE